MKDNIVNDSKESAEKQLSRVVNLVRSLFADEQAQEVVAENISLIDELREVDDDTDSSESMYRQILQEMTDLQPKMLGSCS